DGRPCSPRQPASRATSANLRKGTPGAAHPAAASAQGLHPTPAPVRSRRCLGRCRGAPPASSTQACGYGRSSLCARKSRADHNLPYLLAVAMLDGDVMPAQFEPGRIARADVQQLLKKVSVRPNHEYTEQYPAKMPAK